MGEQRACLAQLVKIPGGVFYKGIARGWLVGSANSVVAPGRSASYTTLAMRPQRRTPTGGRKDCLLDVLKQVQMIEPALAELCRECCRVGSTLRTSIRGRAPWRACIGDEHSLLFGDRNKALARVFARKLQLVAARIKDHELGRRMRALQQA